MSLNVVVHKKRQCSLQINPFASNLVLLFFLKILQYSLVASSKFILYWLKSEFLGGIVDQAHTVIIKNDMLCLFKYRAFACGH